jgi:hypothetical protein
VTSPATLAPAVCSVWTTVAGVTAQRPDIAALLVGSPAVAGQVQSIPAVGLAGAVADATDILFNLSGRQFPGVCSTTVRPVAAPPTWTLAEWTAYWTAVSGNAWSGSWGICNGGESHDACNTPPQIDLGLYPVVAIDEVRIDGVVIPPDEYRVDNNRLLVRVRPTVNADVPGLRPPRWAAEHLRRRRAVRVVRPVAGDLRVHRARRGTGEGSVYVELSAPFPADAGVPAGRVVRGARPYDVPRQRADWGLRVRPVHPLVQPW